MMDVDYWGVVNGTKAFLPHLIASGDGHIINTPASSACSRSPGRRPTTRPSSPSGGFTEALRQEMILAGHPVKVTSVHPGGIKTAIARKGTTAEGLNAAEMAEWFDLEDGPRTSAERAAEIILDGVAKGKAKVLVGTDAKILDLFVRATGSGYQRVLTTLAARYMPKMQ